MVTKLNPKDEFFLFLMRLCLDLRVEDIAYRFSIAKSTVDCSEIFIERPLSFQAHAKT